MKKKLIIAFFILAFLERTVFDFGPNIELVTSAMIISAAYLGRKWSFWPILMLLVVTDLIIGNTKIFIFTWSGFLIPALITPSVFSKIKAKGSKLIGLGTLMGVSSNFFFFIWTNFGVWLLDSWGMYPKNLAGLVSCYINALPFLKNQLISTFLFIPLGFFVLETLFSSYTLAQKTLRLERN
ncbi:DUF6580 family putative transport protein [Patescibacteria group bacterium]